MARMPGWLRAVSDGFTWITLDPSPQLRRLREQRQRESARWPASPVPLPPLPPEAYTEQGALLEAQDWPPA